MPFSRKSDRKKAWFTYERNIICSQTQLDDIAQRMQSIICRQFFADHVVGSQPMKRKTNLPRTIIIIRGGESSSLSLAPTGA